MALPGCIKRFANKRVAHSSCLGVPDRAPTYSEVNAALEVMQTVFLRYRELVTGSKSMRIGPEVEWD